MSRLFNQETFNSAAPILALLREVPENDREDVLALVVKAYVETGGKLAPTAPSADTPTPDEMHRECGRRYEGGELEAYRTGVRDERARVAQEGAAK